MKTDVILESIDGEKEWNLVICSKDEAVNVKGFLRIKIPKKVAIEFLKLYKCECISIRQGNVNYYPKSIK